MSMVLYHGGAMISEGIHTCRRAAIVDTIYTSLRTLYCALNGNGDKQLNSIKLRLDELHIESDMEFAHMLLEEATTTPTVLLTQNHLRNTYVRLENALNTLNVRVEAHRKKWLYSRRVFCVESELHEVGVIKAILDHRLRRLLSVRL